ncbi:hypothetical protein FLK61_38825 [Paenalkalicoccus suaedae]|uniref:Uncharacterized protein n=1 Tax=Paenalkalicoccus suaedae TaxID=2592382 RepID=A0A859FJ85_9BACI|nr:hypothetical protein [Paenalkalicoccus suaedae]QKS72575.1 hypothetical protein FLK61_38825 [Paenalkalicoccus suaedae]
MKVTRARVIGLLVGFVVIVGLHAQGDYHSGGDPEIVRNLLFGVYFVVAVVVMQELYAWVRRWLA